MNKRKQPSVSSALDGLSREEIMAHLAQMDAGLRLLCFRAPLAIAPPSCCYAAVRVSQKQIQLSGKNSL